ncbi:MAG: tetratricopeptide repeat protein, partial [Proteobacteria bacterium]|nr:tetratricopeptide repeat protein [Pseudomonadota bacterium]
MEEKKAKRKLTAILSADVKGYSRLMQDDEEATVRTITAYRGVMSSLIQEHDGRVVDAKGDNVLAEFPSVVDAVRCGVKIQKELKVKNDELLENRRMEFRIGINLGDVIEEEETIYGDGVNIAARLEGIAEGGGICISRTAFDHVKNKLDVGYEYLGEHLVKNIVGPVRVYKVLMEPEYAGEVIGEERPKPKQRRWAAPAIGFIIVVGALAVWNFYFRPPPIEPASVEKMAFPLPEKPSIAVLPFDNLSDDPKQEYFSDGLTEEIITALSKEKRLFVIARNSTFTYKRKPVKVQQVAEELGVRYVLEGSVRKSEDRVRVTAQLIDAVKGHHLWAERYDRPLKEIFALQDEITMKILTALQVKLTEGQQARVFAGGTEDFDAYLKFLEARALAFRYSEQDIMAAKRLLEEAIALDPNYASAYRAMAGTHLVDAVMGFTKSPKDSIKKAIGLAKKAIELDQSMASAYALLGFIFAKARQYDLGISEAQKAVELDPNCADCYAHLGVALHYAGRAEEAVPNLEKAIRLNPFPPNSYWGYLAAAHIYLGHYEDAIGLINKAIKNTPTDLAARISLVLAHSLSGHEKDAHAAAGKLLEMNPKFSIEQYKKMSSHKDRAFLERCAAALHKAGLPETPPLPLPDKPSIAVLPFVNMSEDPKQEYFVDGMTDDLITDLCKISGLFVIARNSVFQYKGKPVDVKIISRELGVRYILEGSVRRAKDQVRINAQLIDATTGGHLWAERYDDKLSDVFSLQDKITRKIVAALAMKLTAGEEAHLAHKETNNIAAYDSFLQG